MPSALLRACADVGDAGAAENACDIYRVGRDDVAEASACGGVGNRVVKIAVEGAAVHSPPSEAADEFEGVTVVDAPRCAAVAVRVRAET